MGACQPEAVVLQCGARWGNPCFLLGCPWPLCGLPQWMCCNAVLPPRFLLHAGPLRLPRCPTGTSPPRPRPLPPPRPPAGRHGLAGGGPAGRVQPVQRWACRMRGTHEVVRSAPHAAGRWRCAAGCMCCMLHAACCTLLGSAGADRVRRSGFAEGWGGALSGEPPRWCVQLGALTLRCVSPFPAARLATPRRLQDHQRGPLLGTRDGCASLHECVHVAAMCPLASAPAASGCTRLHAAAPCRVGELPSSGMHALSG